MIGFKELTGYRILVFCWDNPSVEGYYLNLFDEIAKYVEILPVAIVNSLVSRLRLIKNGVHAFTHKELINCSIESYKNTRDIRHLFSNEVLEDLSDYDRQLGWKWIPQENNTEKEFYLRQASVMVQAYDFFWRYFRPHMAIVWNGVALFQRALTLLAYTYNVPVLFLERGLLPQTLYIDTEGVNYKSSIAGEKWFNNRITYPDKEKIKRAKEYCQKLKEEKKSVVDSGNQISVEEIKAKLGIRASNKVILFPMQIETDSNILYFSPHYPKMIEIIKDIQRAMAQFNDIHLIVKPHPEDRNRVNELRSITNNNTHILDDVNLYSLLELADLIITVNSTVGLEALTFQKPVIVLGKAIYSEKGFTYDLQSRRELPNLMKRAFGKYTFQEKEFLRFLVHILEHKLYHLDAKHDSWNNRDLVTKKIIELLKRRKPNNITLNKVLINKLSANIIFQNIFAREKVILGSIDEKLVGKGKRILHPKEAIKYLLYNLFSKCKPDLVLAAKPLSFKRRILFKLIRSDTKVLLTGTTDLHFVKKSPMNILG